MAAMKKKFKNFEIPEVPHHLLTCSAHDADDDSDESGASDVAETPGSSRHQPSHARLQLQEVSVSCLASQPKFGTI